MSAHCIEVYADFSGQGKHYTQFPDRQSYRITLETCATVKMRGRLRAIWNDPHSLDPTAKAPPRSRARSRGGSREVSKALEKRNTYPAAEVAQFLMRCLFTMFAEEWGCCLRCSRSLDDCQQGNPANVVPLAHPPLAGHERRRFADV